MTAAETAAVLLAAVLAAAAVVLWPVPPRRGEESAFEQPGGPSGRLRRPLGHRRRRVADPTDEVADLAELLALALRTGMPPEAAVRLAGAQCREHHADLLGALTSERPRAVQCEPGGGVATTTRSRRARSPDLPTREVERLLVRAWWLGLDSGAPLAEAMSAVASTLRSVAATRRRERAALAGPAASMWLLTALPILGPVAAMLIGLSPRVLFGSPAGLAALGAGVLLTVSGWSWSRSILRRAARRSAYP